jgi:hypothetical protein
MTKERFISEIDTTDFGILTDEQITLFVKNLLSFNDGDLKEILCYMLDSKYKLTPPSGVRNKYQENILKIFKDNSRFRTIFQQIKYDAEHDKI